MERSAWEGIGKGVVGMGVQKDEVAPLGDSMASTHRQERTTKEKKRRRSPFPF